MVTCHRFGFADLPQVFLIETAALSRREEKAATGHRTPKTIRRGVVV